MFFTAVMFSCNVLNVIPLKCVSMHNQQRKITPQLMNVNSDEPSFYLYSIKVNKCSGSCNNINDPYEKLCVPDVVRNINIKVFNLMSRANGTRNVEWHETCKYKCWLADQMQIIVIINIVGIKKCRCDCKELIGKEIYDKGFIWNPSKCDCKCDKSMWSWRIFTL